MEGEEGVNEEVKTKEADCQDEKGRLMSGKQEGEDGW